MNRAKVLGLEGQAGAVGAGKYADLVILDADPLADSANSARVYRTIKGGVVYDPEALMESIRWVYVGHPVTILSNTPYRYMVL